jgi:hypothetical protein
LKSQPPGRTNAVENHVGRKLEHHDAERHKLLAHIELILGDADIFHEVVCEGVADISLVKFFVPRQ